MGPARRTCTLGALKGADIRNAAEAAIVRVAGPASPRYPAAPPQPSLNQGPPVAEPLTSHQRHDPLKLIFYRYFLAPRGNL